jgi:hypothetical protein
MAHFAEIDETSIVLRVLVVPNSEEADGHSYLANVLGLGGTWIQTSYHGNIRKNFAGIGFTFDPVRNAFIAPKPADAIGFDEETCQWIVPDEAQTL